MALPVCVVVPHPAITGSVVTIWIGNKFGHGAADVQRSRVAIVKLESHHLVPSPANLEKPGQRDLFEPSTKSGQDHYWFFDLVSRIQ